MARRWVESCWFAAGLFTWVSVTALGCSLRPDLGSTLVPLGGLPLLLLLGKGRFSRLPRSIHFLFAIFLAAMGVGIWAAYDRRLAWEKFWMLAASILVYYAMAAQPRQNRWLPAAALSLLGAGLGGYFLLSHDWVSAPARIGLVQRTALEWMHVRPGFLERKAFHAGQVAGIIAVTGPYLAAGTAWAWKQRRGWLVALGAAGLLLTGMAFTAAGSIDAVLALSAAAGLWLLWKAIRMQSAVPRFQPAAVYASTFFILSAAYLVARPFLQSSQTGAWLGALPGGANAARLTSIYVHALPLAKDFLFTGGGLGAFPGLYSTYILGIPSVFVSSSHQLYLDIFIELGVVGLLAFILILGAHLQRLVTWKPDDGLDQPLRGAALAAFTILVLHGLLDNVVFQQDSAALLFLIPGSAVVLLANRESAIELHLPFFSSMRQRAAAGLVVIGLGGALLFFYKPLVAQWQANLGAVAIARRDLAGFPSGKWDLCPQNRADEALERGFLQALSLSPGNVTANYRLGRAMSARCEFDQATAYLAQAYRLAPDHIGIQKALGYSYAWAGMEEQAASLLLHIPEAEQELNEYRGWWSYHGRADLAQSAEDTLAALDRLRRTP